MKINAIEFRRAEIQKAQLKEELLRNRIGDTMSVVVLPSLPMQKLRLKSIKITCLRGGK